MWRLVKLGIIYRQLTPLEFSVLSAIEKGMANHEYVPLEYVERLVDAPVTKVERSLEKLRSLKLIKRWSESYRGFRLTYLGLDMLALRTLVKEGVLEAIGDKLGVGKESELYRARAPGGLLVIAKFLRIGCRSFRSTRRTRSFVEAPQLNWYAQSKIAAEREYKALLELFKAGGLVPRPYAWNRHAVVTSYINGVELYRRPKLDNPERTLMDVLETIRKAYIDARIVHGDLSEYNVIVSVESERAYVIDWPQYVEKDHPSAPSLLKRDVEYIVRFFNKIYGVSLDVDRALNYVTSGG
ncbi:MAG: RIO1 family regulatory kinase/ATPase [Desulfurococcaceae archaeon]|nr:hypothetical protein [Sulfolobales archaeon]MDW8170687.1 RIO1 family regulatory kinase/ATPase [Desulfurococcaceae archaeon]